MHIAYSALQNIDQPTQVSNTENDQLTIRIKAYKAVCNKYSKEIAAIQKYIPGWLPTQPVL